MSEDSRRPGYSLAEMKMGVEAEEKRRAKRLENARIPESTKQLHGLIIALCAFGGVPALIEVSHSISDAVIAKAKERKGEIPEPPTVEELQKLDEALNTVWKTVDQKLLEENPLLEPVLHWFHSEHNSQQDI